MRMALSDAPGDACTLPAVEAPDPLCSAAKGRRR